MTTKEIYSTKEAAQYLEMEYSLFRYHLYEMGHIEPDFRIGKNLAFTKETLDGFKERHRAEGYTIKQAAKYLGVEVSWLRHHIFNTKILAADAKRSQKSIFYKETLDAIRMSHLNQQSPQEEPEPA